MREAVAQLLPRDDRGPQLAEVLVAAKVNADLDAKMQEVGTTGERFVRQVYAEVKSTR